MKKFLSLPIDWFILAIPIVLTTIGIVTIYTITYPDYHWKLTFDQITYAAIGLTAMVILMFTDYRMFSSIPGIIYLVGLLFLAPLLPFLAPKLPFVTSTFGATRWIDLGFFQIQPSEIFKLLGAIVAAAFLSKRVGRITVSAMAAYAVMMAIPLVMVYLEPNLSTTIVLLVMFTGMFLAAKPSGRMVAILVGVALVAVPIVFFSLKPYQRTRIDTFLHLSTSSQNTENTDNKTNGKDYNVKQSLIAVGSGGLTGQGFGQGSQTVLNFLPVAHSDFIFAGFAEATGFIGSFILLGLYILLIMRIITLAGLSVDPFGQLLAVGLSIKIFFQVVVHVGTNLGLLPVTGIPLPFMSYGGTSMIIDLASIGILLNIYIRHKKFIFS